MTDRKSDLTLALGRAILSDERFEDSDWGQLVLVATRGADHWRLSGFLYTGDEVASAAPRGLEVGEAIEHLRAFDPDCRALVVSIDRTAGKFITHMEYDDPGRYVIDSDTAMDLSVSLRP